MSKIDWKQAEKPALGEKGQAVHRPGSALPRLHGLADRRPARRRRPGRRPARGRGRRRDRGRRARRYPGHRHLLGEPDPQVLFHRRPRRSPAGSRRSTSTSGTG
ncbi:MAG: hypothetical protein M0C28_46370 [Candidatus Moduliflexus flocculans]|nr:hypothetical protein [Candidatus Moduliflexus flocculans]